MKEPTPRFTLSIHTSQPFASACIVALGCQTPYGRLPGIATTTALADLPCVYLLSHLSKPPPSTALEAFGRPSGGWRTRALASVYGSSSLYSCYLSSRGQGGTKAGDPFTSSSESRCNVGACGDGESGVCRSPFSVVSMYCSRRGALPEPRIGAASLSDPVERP